jgi:hypothetical protein
MNLGSTKLADPKLPTVNERMRTHQKRPRVTGIAGKPQISRRRVRGKTSTDRSDEDHALARAR